MLIVMGASCRAFALANPHRVPDLLLAGSAQNDVRPLVGMRGVKARVGTRPNGPRRRTHPASIQTLLAKECSTPQPGAVEHAGQRHRHHPLNLPISHASSARVRRTSRATGKVARRQPGARCFA